MQNIYRIKLYLKTPTFFAASAPISGSLYILLLKLKFIKLYKVASRTICIGDMTLLLQQNIFKLPYNGAESAKLVGASVL